MIEHMTVRSDKQINHKLEAYLQEGAYGCVQSFMLIYQKFYVNLCDAEVSYVRSFIGRNWFIFSLNTC